MGRRAGRGTDRLALGFGDSLARRHGRPRPENREARGTRQEGVSRLDRRTDMYVSTHRNYIRATGGGLRITAVFPNGAVEISQFQDVEHQKKD